MNKNAAIRQQKAIKLNYFRNDHQNTTPCIIIKQNSGSNRTKPQYKPLSILEEDSFGRKGDGETLVADDPIDLNLQRE